MSSAERSRAVTAGTGRRAGDRRRCDDFEGGGGGGGEGFGAVGEEEGEGNVAGSSLSLLFFCAFYFF
jgi:hypothetical protein